MKVVRHAEILARDLEKGQARRVAESAALRPGGEIAIDGE